MMEPAAETLCIMLTGPYQPSLYPPFHNDLYHDATSNCAVEISWNRSTHASPHVKVEPIPLHNIALPLTEHHRGSIPTAVSLALYQSTAASEVYQSLGFLVAIIAVVTVNLLPRAKLIQMTLTICAFTAIAIPLAMLATWSSLQARYHTDPQGLHAYNSSQSAITGVWLFFHIWLSNSIQARYPHLLIPTILYNIFMIVQFTSCSRFTTWTQCWDLIYLTTRCYFTGVAISFVSGMFIYPVTCRSEIFEVQEKYIRSAQGVLQQAFNYIKSMGDVSESLADAIQPQQPPDDSQTRATDEQGDSLQQKMSALKTLYVKMHAELIMAKREVAWGKLGADDITSISNLCRRLLMPIGGLAHLKDLYKAVDDPHHLAPEIKADSTSKMSPWHDDAVWSTSFGALIAPASNLINAIDDGLEHSGLMLEIIQESTSSRRARSEDQPDLESKGELMRPGDRKFATHLEGLLLQFKTDRLDSLTPWLGNEDHTDARTTTLRETADIDNGNGSSELESLHDPRLNLVLYTHHMLYTAGLAVLELCKFSDSLVSQGVMSHNRLICPSVQVIGQWLASVFDTSEAAVADEDRPNSKEEEQLIFGQTRRGAHNVEHLPPTNVYQQFGVRLGKLQRYLKGSEFSFGFRSACATMSCAILAYLHPTQDIFTHYRLIWSVIIAAIGANMSAGQSGVSYVLRILGSLAALIICYLVWYIPNGNTAGVIVMMWFASFIQMYFLIRWPRHIIGWLVILITEVLSIGYLTQVNKIGVEAATARGVIYYKPYEVCAVRVACVLWGTLASIFFTYLPYPITARSLMRDQLSKSMHLVANYNMIVHHTLKFRLRGTEGDSTNQQSRGYVLAKARKAMFHKTMALNASVRHSLYLQKYEPTLGGKFPVAKYKDILDRLSLLLEYTALMSYSTQAWSTHGPHAQYHQHSISARQWMQDLCELIESANIHAQKISCVLYQLSDALSTGRQLPGPVDAVKPYELWQNLEQFDPQILHRRHVRELGYSTYAVVELLSGVVANSVNELSRDVEFLVGVTHFDIMADGYDEAE
ncbi:hypothetical protein E4T38_09536 [Aureobasidium subglaciale]|nr:hypothetical protein E4T38_09536 [Aureobasidium subglaciale]KAI5213746.1 hypothetical protein E4T40_09478 [Aureobasidium subglaciale]KAI5215625.1 hypothetical protein E4T41_09515 [Aureobasidium subglaciale]KAI5253677.1 hypothetical protein E4T46_09470 [Aureobasidium subglaciale]